MESDSAHYIDKPSTIKDRRNNVVHSVWTEFDKYKSASSLDSSFIMYSRMEGKTWTTPKRISYNAGNCGNSDSTLKADVPCMGPENELFICWAGPGGIYFQRSPDNGDTWLEKEIFVAPMKNGWDQEIKGVRTPGIPRMASVNDSGQYHGRIYICWSDEKNGVTNKDVFLVYSDDKGESWTEPVLVTYRPNHREQFSPNINIQPETGTVFMTYFDKQNYVDGRLSDLYLAISNNGGLKFEYYRLNETPIVLDTMIAPVRGLAFLPKSTDVKAVWSQTDEKDMLSIFSVMITDSTINEYIKRDGENELRMERSFPFAKKISITFDSPVEGKYTALITQPLLPGKEVVAAKDSPLVKGSNTLLIDTKKAGLKKGNYVLTFYHNNRNSFVWITGE